MTMSLAFSGCRTMAMKRALYRLRLRIVYLVSTIADRCDTLAVGF
jgi:hypothetical protein